MFIFMLLLLLTLPLHADSGLINQENVGKNTCGACALIHSLSVAGNKAALSHLNGKDNREKAKFFIEKYGSLKSPIYHNKKTVYQPETGISDKDFLLTVNQVLENSQSPRVKGEFIIKKEDASPEEFVSNLHSMLSQSIEKGFHPLTAVRALAAEYLKKSDKYLWNSKGGHWVAVHKVGKLSPDKLSFSFTFSDSLSSKMQQGYFSINLHRGAVVPMTFEVDENGKEKWNWVSNKNTIELHSPGMPLGTKRANWHERTFIALRYVIYR